MKIELVPEKYFREGTYFSSRFGNEIEVSVESDETVSDAYIEHCIRTVEGFSDEMLDCICAAAKRYCLAFIALCKEAMGDDFSFEHAELPFVTEETPVREMCGLMQISGMIISEPEDENRMDFTLTGSCEWEIEHGIEITFVDGKPVYLGTNDGVRPSDTDYYVTGEGRAWNYAIEGE